MKKKMNVVVVGAAGRMGAQVVELLRDHKDAQILKAVCRTGEIKRFSISDRMRPAVVIDFSSPEGFLESLAWCEKNGVSLVSGTTGLSARHEKALKKASGSIAVFWAPNMSFGINLFAEFIKQNGKTLRQYDLQLEEIHHSRKKDAPSGTAIRLQKALSKATGKNLPNPLSVRGGGVFGIHKLWIMGEDEVLTVEHTALNRQVFAQGAIRAALWLSKKNRGFFSFEDLLK